MENSSKLIFILSFCFISHQAFTVKATVPALYVFGDSHVDAGNNLHLHTDAQANRFPYGIDLNNTYGRFTNGKNMADFIASYLGLPLVPAILDLPVGKRNHRIITGTTFASGSCGILSTTGAGHCLRLAQQVQIFNTTIQYHLSKEIRDPQQLKQHLTDSIYLVLVGNNDYNDAMSRNETHKHEPSDYADILINETTKNLQKLYAFGARKFVLSGVSNCAPGNYTIPACRARYFADKLPDVLQRLQSSLSGSLFTMYDVHKVYSKIVENPLQYGITNVTDPCWLEGGIPCPDRSKYLRWDPYSHQTQVAYEIAAKDCFNGTACAPYNIEALANA